MFTNCEILCHEIYLITLQVSFIQYNRQLIFNHKLIESRLYFFHDTELTYSAWRVV